MYTNFLYIRLSLPVFDPSDRSRDIRAAVDRLTALLPSKIMPCHIVLIERGDCSGACVRVCVYGGGGGGVHD